jgi:hypothetical protein
MQEICCRIVALALFAAIPAGAAAQGAAESAQVQSRGLAPSVVEHFLIAPDLSERDPAQAAELTRWMDEFLEWQTWAAQWTGRRERGWLTAFRDRRQKPAPPAWLAAECETTVVDDGLLGQGCTLLAEWSDDRPGAQGRHAQAAAMTQGEEPPRVVWWEHVHLDVLWPAAQWQSSTYGVVGTHVSATVYGRLQVFLAPGAMFLNVPTRNGARAWKIATNYGIGYRLVDFSFPGQQRATLHVNLAKAWLMSDTADMLSRRSMDFVGFSMTFKKP